MENDFQFLDIILFAAIAAFFVLRLRGVLGKRDGFEEPPRHDPFGKKKDGEDDKVIPLPDRRKGPGDNQDQDAGFDEAEGAESEPAEDVAPAEVVAKASQAAKAAAEDPGPETPLGAGLAQIRAVDKDFEEEAFVGGAKSAFEMVINAFAAGDTKTMRPLLSNDVFGDFSGAIEERQNAGQNLETTMVGITSADIVEAEVQGRTSFITIKFVSEQVNVVRDKEGEVVEGDPSHVTKITDIWTFARNTRSRDPNWTLVATGSPN